MSPRNRVSLLLYVAGSLLLLAVFEHQALDLALPDLLALTTLEAMLGAGIALFVSTDYKRRMNHAINRMRRQLSERMAKFDPTASFSAEYFMQRLQQECDRSRRYKLDLTLLVLRFNPKGNAVNTDTLVASVGADVFTHVAMAMRREDVLGRLDRMDYGIYLPHTGRAGAEVVAKRLVAALKVYEPTVGVAVYGEDGTTSNTLLLAGLRDGARERDRDEIRSAWNGGRVTVD